MKSFLKASVCLTLALFTHLASTQGFNDLIKPAYIYAEAKKANVNWMYIGLAPRMQDPQRVKVVMAKASFTMRVAMDMTVADVADYPNYLSRRYRRMKQIIGEENLTIPQQYRFDEFEKTILAIENDLRTIPKDLMSRYTYGIQLLKRHFPLNIFEIIRGGAVVRVEAHFVYPMTIHKSVTWPKPGIYRPYDIDERRSYYSKKVYSHIFGGFPAIWLDPTGKGTGVHGPIRYSNADEARRDGVKGKMREFWNENNFLNEGLSPVTDLEAAYRWDVVRRANSDGCFRAETLELRHLLPSDAQRIKDDNKEFRNLASGPGRNTTEIDYDSVVFEIIPGYDYLTVEGHMTNRIVDVDYYVSDPYKKPDATAWLKNFMLTEKERESSEADVVLQTRMTNEVYTFPYLDPGALEYYIPNRGASSRTMILLIEAHRI